MGYVDIILYKIKKVKCAIRKITIILKKGRNNAIFVEFYKKKKWVFYILPFSAFATVNFAIYLKVNYVILLQLYKC